MSKKLQYIKLSYEIKENVKKKLKIPNTYDDLLGIIKSFIKNDDPNMLYQIYDIKLKKNINNDEEYQIFLKEHSSEISATLSISLVDKNSINIKKAPEYQLESSNICFESCIKPKKNEIKIEKEKEEEEDEDEDLNEEDVKDLTEEEKIKKSLRLMVRSKLKNLEKNIIS